MGLSASLIHRSAETVFGVWLFAIVLPALPWNQDWVLQGLEMMKAVAAGQVIRTGAIAIGVLVFVHGPHDLAQVGIVEILAATAAALFYIGVQHVRIVPIGLRFSIPDLRGLLKKGSSVGPSQIVWTVN